MISSLYHHTSHAIFMYILHSLLSQRHDVVVACFELAYLFPTWPYSVPVHCFPLIWFTRTSICCSL